MGANYVSGNPLMIDWTPGSAVAAGDPVVVNNSVCIAHLPIAANALGALSFPSGTAVYDVNKLSTDVVTAGADIYWDAGNSRATITASTHKKIGIAIAAAGNGVTIARIVNKT